MSWRPVLKSGMVRSVRIRNRSVHVYGLSLVSRIYELISTECLLDSYICPRVVIPLQTQGRCGAVMSHR